MLGLALASAILPGVAVFGTGSLILAAILENFQVAGFWSALFGSMIVSMTGTVSS